MQIRITGFNYSDAGIIRPIKAVRALTGMGLKESKEFVEYVRDFGSKVLVTDATVWTASDALEEAGLRFHVVQETRRTPREVLEMCPQDLSVQDVLQVLEAFDR